MMSGEIYHKTSETKAELKLFRIRLIELQIITLTAIFILLTFTKDSLLLIPSFAIAVNIVFVVIALIVGANKQRSHHGKDIELELSSVSYEFKSCEYIVLLIYMSAIICLVFIMARSIWPW
jgi:hypothetical protein